MIAAAAYAARHLLPVYPVRGYSITRPIVDPRHAPESISMEKTHKVTVTRLGDRIRVGGTTERAGCRLKLCKARRDTLKHAVTDLFACSCDVKHVEFRCGLRPMTPDGTPVIGSAK